eukprot:217008_1
MSTCSCKRFIHKQLGEWLILAKDAHVKPEDLHKRLENYWTIVSTISALIAGFSYLIANQDIKFENENIGQNGHDRYEVFGALVITTFLTSLISTLMAALLLSYLNICGVENTKWFIKTFWYLPDIPITFCGLSICLMLFNSLIGVGGLYSAAVWYFALTVGLMSVLIIGFLTYIMRSSVHKKIFLQSTQNNNDK